MMAKGEATTSSAQTGAAKSAIDKLGSSVSYNAGFHSKMIGFVSCKAEGFYKGSSCLVLGPSEGGETELQLDSKFSRVVCVDGSSRVLAELKKKCPGYTYVHSLFEELTLEEKFDVILMFHILEHIDSPVELLKRSKAWLKQGGIIIICVPNANSLHRMLGVEMGLLKDVHELNDSDRKVGHKRVYDFASLYSDIRGAGLVVAEERGVYLKPFSNAQMEKLPDSQVEGFFRLGDKFKDNAAEIMVVCRA